jgi:protein SCO1
VQPATLLDWSNALDGLGQEGRRFKVLFVSVDHERDTPENLQAYMRSFNPGITALTGSAEQIKAAAALVDATYAKSADANGHYTYDHTVKTYFVGVDRHLFGTIDPNSEAEIRRSMVQRLSTD